MFTRCDGEASHNQPGTPLYIPGEPPNFPARHFNYTPQCLDEGFARVGWPATGDLRDPGWKARGQLAYGPMLPRHRGYLEHFAHIRVGDLVVIPAYREQYDVHIGMTVPPRREEPNLPPRRPDGSA